MEIFNSISDLRKKLSRLRAQERKIGFVPTMGALHEGHISLIKSSKKDSDITSCSIYVNPSQFNDKKDFQKYPRTMEEDIKKLESSGCDILFAPTESEIMKFTTRQILPLESLGNVMEGKYRPCHFNGVTEIVSKLFDIIEPHTAYFGEKDYQQLAIVKYLVEKLNMPVKIKSVATVREHDGLAMSSRNSLLTGEERRGAASIYKILSGVKQKAARSTVEGLKLWVEKEISKVSCLKLEYFEIANTVSLMPVNYFTDTEGTIACIAVYAGNVRLIDNIII